MKRGQRGILDVIEGYVDMVFNLLAIVAAYLLALLVKGDSVIDEAGNRLITLNHPWTVALVMLNVIMASFVFTLTGLYKPGRYRGRFSSFSAPLRANIIYYGLMAIVVLLATRKDLTIFFLWWVLFAAILSTVFLTFKRTMIQEFQRAFLKKHLKLRRIIIVGDNTEVAKEYIKQSKKDIESGDVILGFVGDKITDEIGVDKLGGVPDLSEVLDKHNPTDVIFALNTYNKAKLIKLVNMCEDRCVRVFFLPVAYGFFKSPKQIEEVGSLPVINVHSTPLDNYANAFLKRAIDIVGSLILIILTSPIMLFAAIGVKLSSPGPVIFKQTRVGKMGKKFMMLKFRSMRINSISNKTWTTDTDSRKTKFGNFIRKTAIDELPQLFNVLAGEMSLVGPRPEIPVFVEQFKEVIPLYMVKHYVKPGMTGLAQVKGLRGDTSVEDRIHEDIEYIENWSLWLDLYILMRTPFSMINKNEKYVDEVVLGELLDDETTREEA